jgi:NAD(P)-dependent dehydrogenase (short-subunit alcohol dehydrogenase family)
MDLQLHEKRALVTGGSRGVGRAIALQLAQEGVDVVIAARGHEALAAAASELAATTGRRVIPSSADVSLDPSVDSLIARTIELLGGLDILVNCAAIPGAGLAAKIGDIDVATLLHEVDVKVGGYLRVARAVVPHMLAGGWGRIINIGGMAARRAGNYVGAVRSAAISAITKNLTEEFGARGVTAVAIHPGFLRGPQSSAVAEERARQGTNIRRLIEVSEIAYLAAVLASPRCTAVSGETLQAAGGMPGIINY